MSQPPDGIRELHGDETALAYEVMTELRTGISPEAFVARVDGRQRPRGYRLIADFSEGRPVAIAGFRILENLAIGAPGGTATPDPRGGRETQVQS